jgi:site-specific DNA-adenine methylase
METTALAPWFGSSRMIGKYVGEELRGCRWVGVPFAGGMCELAHIDAPSLVVSDLHREIINLCWSLQQPEFREKLITNLHFAPFHPDALESAQELCRKWREAKIETHRHQPAIHWAEAYFIASWMGRSGKAGTDGEFKGGLSTRWNANGGDSNTRYRSALASIDEWTAIMERCNFHVMDAFDFLAEALTRSDRPECGIYVDAPWPDDGDKYLHKFDEAKQRKLAEELSRFDQARIVIRYGDHPLIRELYPEPRWTWRSITGRTQANSEKAEVLILNGPSRASNREPAASKGMFA